jgi:hypothetical protein
MPPKCRRFPEIIPKIEPDVSKGFSRRDTIPEKQFPTRIRVEKLGLVNQK